MVAILTPFPLIYFNHVNRHIKGAVISTGERAQNACNKEIHIDQASLPELTKRKLSLPPIFSRLSPIAKTSKAFPIADA